MHIEEGCLTLQGRTFCANSAVIHPDYAMGYYKPQSEVITNWNGKALWQLRWERSGQTQYYLDLFQDEVATPIIVRLSHGRFLVGCLAWQQFHLDLSCVHDDEAEANTDAHNFTSCYAEGQWEYDEGEE